MKKISCSKPKVFLSVLLALVGVVTITYRANADSELLEKFKEQIKNLPPEEQERILEIKRRHEQEYLEMKDEIENQKQQKVQVKSENSKLKVTPQTKNIPQKVYELEKLEIENKDKSVTELKPNQNKVIISKESIETQSNSPVEVDLTESKIEVPNSEGNQKELKIMPNEILKNLLLTKQLDKTKYSPTNETLNLTSDENGNLVYEVEGTKTKKLFGILNMNLSRKAVVSAETGQITSIQESFFTKLLNSISL